MASSNFFKLGANNFNGGGATSRPHHTKSKSTPNVPTTDKLSAADQLAKETQAVFDSKLSEVLDEQSREILKKEQELKLHPDGGQFGRLDLPTFHPDQPRGGQTRLEEALQKGKWKEEATLDDKSDPKLLVQRILELEQGWGMLQQEAEEELFRRDREHEHTKELLAFALEKLRRLGVDPTGNAPRRPFASGQNSAHNSPEQVFLEQLRVQQEYEDKMARLSNRGSPLLDRPMGSRISPFSAARAFHGPSSLPSPGRMFPPAGTRPVPRASPFDSARDPHDLYA